jgi:hypothetical protein
MFPRAPQRSGGAVGLFQLIALGVGFYALEEFLTGKFKLSRTIKDVRLINN